MRRCLSARERWLIGFRGQITWYWELGKAGLEARFGVRWSGMKFHDHDEEMGSPEQPRPSLTQMGEERSISVLRPG